MVKLQLSEIITAHKRSLGQGNIFRSVCQEFCPGGGRVCSWGVSARGGVCSRGVSAPGEVCSWGVCSWGGLLGGLCSWGGAGGDPPGRPLLRAVRILLECILVLFENDFRVANVKEHRFRFCDRIRSL